MITRTLDTLTRERMGKGKAIIVFGARQVGKTTLLRAFTPPALRAFWHSRNRPELSESFQKLLNRGLLTEGDLYDIHNVTLVHHVNQSVRAHKPSNQPKVVAATEGAA